MARLGLAALVLATGLVACAPASTGRTNPDGSEIYDRLDRRLRTDAPYGVFELRLYAVPNPVLPPRPAPAPHVRNPDGTVTPPLWTEDTEREFRNRQKRNEAFDRFPGLDTFGDLPQWTLHLPNRSLLMGIYGNPRPGKTLPEEPYEALSGGVTIRARLPGEAARAADFGARGEGVFSLGFSNNPPFSQTDCITDDEWVEERGKTVRKREPNVFTSVHTQLDGWALRVSVPSTDLAERARYCAAARQLADALTVARDPVSP